MHFIPRFISRTGTRAASVGRRGTERLELKYCVPDSIAASVLEVARLFLQPETGLRFGQSQRITSLYLDTPDLQFMRRHLEDAPDRFKLRIRAYGDPPWPSVYAEIKQKRGGVSRKRRARIAASDVPAVLDGIDLSFARGWGREAAANLQEFAWRRVTHGATSKVLVRSTRESLRGGLGDATAVTVDRGIACQPSSGFDIAGPPDAWRPIPLPLGSASAVVLELKHGARPPAWMMPIIRGLAAWRVSFSKYVAAMRVLRRWEVHT